jgi:hypothetical protein
MSIHQFFDSPPDDWGHTLSAVTLFRAQKPMLGYTPEWAQGFAAQKALSWHAIAAVGIAYAFATETNVRLYVLRTKTVGRFIQFMDEQGPYGLATLSALAILIQMDEQLAKDLIAQHYTAVIHSR